MKNILWLLLVAGLVSCRDLYQYNINEVRLAEEDRDLNRKALQALQSLPVKDTFRFVVIGDSQRFYDQLDGFVRAVNREEAIAFVLLNGDITDFGLNREYRWVARSLRGLKAPFLGVIGNHDMLANGRAVYNQMFGPENFSFTYGPNKFVCLNTNSLEVGKDGSLPDIPWLEGQLADLEGYRNVFVFSHMSPLDTEFDERKALPYSGALARSGKVRLSVHGHQHSFNIYQPYEDGIPYLVVASMNKRSYALVTVTGEGYRIEQKFY